MSAKLKLSYEEVDILSKLDTQTLIGLREILQGSNFKALLGLADNLIIIEKNKFFGEVTLDAQKLFESHAHSRGGVLMAAKFIRIIQGVEHELARRDEERRKK